MLRSPLPLLICALGAASALAQTPQALTEARALCDSDVQRLCAGVPSGGGRVIACLKQHQSEVSSSCKQAIAKAVQGAGSSPPASAAPTPSAPANVSPGVPANVSPTAANAASTATTATSTASATSHPGKSPRASGERYFLMKQVKIIDQGAGQGRPAYDLMIPTTWQFKGWVNVNAAEGGCFADWFAVVGDAKSADGAIEMEMLPQFTFQYMDDPAAQRQVQQENQSAARVGMKPCPLRAPVHAAEFLRQDLIAKYSKGKTLVGIEPFPELDQIVRRRMGLPPDAAGGNVRTEAARARLAYENASGKSEEEFLSAVIVVRTVPNGGRGALYDWHAVMVMSFHAPKGQLDANDKLFKLIASTIHPEPQWQQWSNGVIVELYKKKQEEEAKQSAIIAQLQNYAIQTINGVIAYQQQGSYNSAVGASQLIRGVQTFRDPSTGATFELSNQYDHAWLNGADQYVLSDDPNFNPNGSLNGNWTALQVVRPQP